MIHRPFRLPAPGGEVVAGEVRIRQGAPPRSAVVLVHGFKGFRKWGFLPYLARRLAVRGYAAVTFDFSLNGIDEDPERITALEKFARNTYSRELEELSLILDALCEGDLAPRRPDRVGLLGYSRGGGDAVLAARSDGRIRALATWAPVRTFDRWREETRRTWREEGRVWVLDGRTGTQLPLDVSLLEDVEENRAALDVEAAAAEVDVPWLIVHGEDDVTVSADEGRALARASGARLVLLEGADHTFGAGHPFGEPTEVLDRAVLLTVDHFDAHLGSG